jgi:hypothetical protein
MKTAAAALALAFAASAFTPALAAQPVAPVGAALSTPALASQTTPAAQSAPMVAPQEEQVCKRQRSGSSRSSAQRVCKTRSQWRAEEANSDVQAFREGNDRRR